MSQPDFHVKPLSMMILDLALVLEGSQCQIGPKAHKLYNADPKVKTFFSLKIN